MKNWWLWFIAGLLSFIGGCFAWANPLAATLTVEMLAGWSFIFSGVTSLFSIFGNKETKSRIISIALGILLIALGASLLKNPLQGIISLTIVVGSMILCAGISRIVLAFKEKGNARWVILLSGVLSLLLGIMIFSNFPQSAATLLGIFLAVELLSNGISLMALSFARKNMRL